MYEVFNHTRDEVKLKQVKVDYKGDIGHRNLTTEIVIGKFINLFRYQPYDEHGRILLPVGYLIKTKYLVSE